MERRGEKREEEGRGEEGSGGEGKEASFIIYAAAARDRLGTRLKDVHRQVCTGQGPGMKLLSGDMELI